MKNVEALNKDGNGLLYLRNKFPVTGEANARENIFISPQIG
jgi:hypothetical protein